MVRLLPLLPLLLGVGACSGAPEAPEPLDDLQLLVRASLDLRGVRPSLAELDAVEGDPAQLEPLIGGFVDDERFGARVRSWFAPIYGTQVDQFAVGPEDYGLAAEFAPRFSASVGEAPLRLVERVAVQDRPWTDLVTADFTMTDELLGQVWPVAREGGGWQPSVWTDGRPPAGLLSGNSLWWRYPSNGANHHRGRANQISRIFLCQDYLDRAVSFPRDVDLTDDDAIRDALRTNAGCVNCHISLDSLASYLFGFTYVQAGVLELTRYHPERERSWESATGVAPAFFGDPGFSLADLGHQIAADPRFVQCATEQVWQALMQRPASLADADAITTHREAFLDGGLTLRPLVRSIVADPRYRARTDELGGAPVRMADPLLWGSQIEALTGYRFTVSGADMLQADTSGLRSLAGGADGQTGGEGASQPTPTMLLVQERIAQAAAHFAAVSAEGSGARDLFPEGFPADPSSEATVRQLRHLHWRLFARRVDPTSLEVTELQALLSELLAARTDPVEAWADLLSVLLRDPDLLVY